MQYLFLWDLKKIVYYLHFVHSTTLVLVYNSRLATIFFKYLFSKSILFFPVHPHIQSSVTQSAPNSTLTCFHAIVIMLVTRALNFNNLFGIRV